MLNRLLLGCIFSLSFIQAEGLWSFDRVVWSNNDKYANISIDYRKNDDQSYLMNFSMHLNFDLSKIAANFRMNVQKDDKDQDFKWEVIRTTLDMQTIYRSIQIFPFLNSLYGDFVSRIDAFKKYPVKKVISFFCNNINWFILGFILGNIQFF
jgi:hypothetical protein